MRPEYFKIHTESGFGMSEERTFLFDPKALIQPPFIPCPRCGAEAFGVLFIQGHHFFRRCAECWHHESYRLPPVSKRVVYLDQFAISNMMKALNPDNRVHQKGGTSNAFWLPLFEKLDQCCKLQLIVCPESAAHNKESRVSPYYEALKRMYELLSRSVSFRDSDWIQGLQVNEHLKHWLVGNGEYEPELRISSVVHGEIDVWTERYTVSVDIPWKEEWIADLRRQRDELSEEITKIFSRWRGEPGRRFNDWFEEEVLAFGQNHLKGFGTQLKKYADIQVGERVLTMNDLVPASSVKLVMMVRHALINTGTSNENDWPKKTIEYLTSSSLKSIPFLKISSMIWAAIARKAASGMKRPPSRGMSNDVETISTLLPYCDAMFIDDECRGYLNEEPLRSELSYGTKLFSQNNKDEFIDYLEGTKASITDEQLNYVRGVYGDDWLKPYTSLYRTTANET